MGERAISGLRGMGKEGLCADGTKALVHMSSQDDIPTALQLEELVFEADTKVQHACLPPHPFSFSLGYMSGQRIRTICQSLHIVKVFRSPTPLSTSNFYHYSRFPRWLRPIPFLPLFSTIVPCPSLLFVILSRLSAFTFRIFMASGKYYDNTHISLSLGLLLATFIGVALYNVIELTALVFKTTKKHQAFTSTGFWSPFYRMLFKVPRPHPAGLPLLYIDLR